MKPFIYTVADNVAACSASLAFNELDSIRRLPASEAYERLRQLVLNSIIAYTEATSGCFGLPPTPSPN
jgi:hypothetical protein